MSEISDFIRVPLTPSIRSTALEEAKKLGKFNGSYRGEAGQVVGFIGEYVVSNYYKPHCEIQNTYGYDGIFKTYDGKILTYDVKTKDRTGPPKPVFEASVPQYVENVQNPDYYIFVSLLRFYDLYTDAYIVGYLSKEEFFKKRYAVETGPKDNGAIIWTKMWNVYIKDLNSPKNYFNN